MKTSEDPGNAAVEVLIVEDSPTQALQLTHMLKRHGYRTAIANNGREALTRLHQRRPLIVISDIVMPEMDGYELCRSIKADEQLANIPVILLTSLSDSKDVFKGLECGADNFIVKPYDEKFLLSRIQFILANQQLRQVERAQMGLEIFFAGQRYFITSDRLQILNLLLSTYEAAVQKNLELIKARDELQRFNEQLEARVAERTAALAAEIAERKQSEERLREAEARYRALVETTPAITYSADLTEEVSMLYVSPQTEILLGFSAEEWRLNPARWVKQLHSEDRPRVLEAFERTRTEGVPFKMEYRLLARDGTPRWFHDHGLVVNDATRNKRTIYGTLADVTELKQAEAEIRRLNEELEQRVRERTAQLETTNQELEAFSYSVSHDLRMPLRHIDGFASLLKDHIGSILDDKGRGYFEKISQAVTQMDQLIDDLLAFSRMGRTEMHRTKLSLERLVREVLADLQDETRGRDIVWRIAPLPQVRGDPFMLRLVLSNLMANAVKYTQPRARAEIDISCITNESEIVFCIRDNGVGFDMQYVDRLFGVFQRLHSVSEFEGTGIGLANVRRIIHRHGGRTWAEGKVEGGAAFYFSLPDRKEPTV